MRGKTKEAIRELVRKYLDELGVIEYNCENPKFATKKELEELSKKTGNEKFITTGSWITVSGVTVSDVDFYPSVSYLKDDVEDDIKEDEILNNKELSERLRKVEELTNANDYEFKEKTEKKLVKKNKRGKK